MNNLSINSTQRGDHLGAEYYLKLALKLATTTGNLDSQHDIHSNLANNYIALGYLELAAKHLDKSLEIAKMIGKSSGIAISLNLKGTLLKKLGDRVGAELHFKEALAGAQQHNLQFVACSILLNLAELVSQTDKTQAKLYIQNAAKLSLDLKNPDLIQRAVDIEQSLM